MTDLHGIPLFEGLPEEELQWLSDNSREQLLEGGQFFLREGEPAEWFYVVLEGELQITRTFSGREMVLGTTPPML